MKQVFLYLLLIGLPFAAAAQESLTITQCYEMARRNYPLIKQYALIEKTEQYNLANAAKGWLPQLAINAKATYQSDVTKLPFDAEQISALIPGFNIPTVSKDQYQVVAELNQTIWDGGMIHSTREATRAQATADKEQLESDLYALNERVNQLFFGCLLQEELLKQNALLQNELRINIDRIKAMINNGLANESDRESMEVELLNARQREVEIKAAREAYRLMLGTLIGAGDRGQGAGKESFVLLVPCTLPLAPANIASGDISRPELRALDAKAELADVRNRQINAGLMPRLGLFVQGGYGRPGLNMLKDDFEPFYVAGVRLSWNLGNLYTLKTDRKKVETSRGFIDLQREIFLFNTSLELTRQHTEIRKIDELLESDSRIVALRESIKKAAEAKLENGVIAVTDLIREINAEDMARQNIATHRIQRLMAIYNYIYTTNNK